VSIISSYSLILHLLLTFAVMQATPILSLQAVRQAKLARSLGLCRSDWEILECLYWAKKGLSFCSLQRQFSATDNPRYGQLNSWYYQGIARLILKGYVSETLSPKGWRRWQITASGRVEIDKLNEAAIKLLEQWEKDGM
jgi:hypothetical protein